MPKDEHVVFIGMVRITTWWGTTLRCFENSTKLTHSGGKLGASMGSLDDVFLMHRVNGEHVTFFSTTARRYLARSVFEFSCALQDMDCEEVEPMCVRCDDERNRFSISDASGLSAETGGVFLSVAQSSSSLMRNTAAGGDNAGGSNRTDGSLVFLKSFDFPDNLLRAQKHVAFGRNSEQWEVFFLRPVRRVATATDAAKILSIAGKEWSSMLGQELREQVDAVQIKTPFDTLVSCANDGATPIHAPSRLLRGEVAASDVSLMESTIFRRFRVCRQEGFLFYNAQSKRFLAVSSISSQCHEQFGPRRPGKPREIRRCPEPFPRCSRCNDKRSQLSVVRASTNAAGSGLVQLVRGTVSFRLGKPGISYEARWPGQWEALSLVVLPSSSSSALQLAHQAPSMSHGATVRIRTYFGDFVTCNKSTREVVRRSDNMENDDDLFDVLEVCEGGGVGDALRSRVSGKYLAIEQRETGDGSLVCSDNFDTHGAFEMLVALQNPSDPSHGHWAMEGSTVKKLHDSTAEVMGSDFALLRTQFGMYLRARPQTEKPSLDLVYTPAQWESFMLDAASPVSKTASANPRGVPMAWCLPIGDKNFVLLLRNVAVLRRSGVVVELHVDDPSPPEKFRQAVQTCQTAFEVRLMFPSQLAPRATPANTRKLSVINFMHWLNYHIYHGLYVSAGFLVQETIRLMATDVIRNAKKADTAARTTNELLDDVIPTTYWKIGGHMPFPEARVVRELWEMYANFSVFHVGVWVVDEFITLPPLFSITAQALVPYGRRIFATVRRDLIRRFGDGNLSATGPVRYDPRPRVANPDSQRIRGMDPLLAYDLAKLLQKHAGPLAPQRHGAMEAMSLKDQFHIIRSASHFLCGEGAFLSWIPFARPGSTFVVTLEYFGDFSWHDYVFGNVLHFHYFLQEMRRPDVRVIFVLAEHNATLVKNISDAMQFAVGRTAVAPLLAGLGGLLSQRSPLLTMDEGAVPQLGEKEPFRNLSASTRRDDVDVFGDVFHLSRFGMMRGIVLPNAPIASEEMRRFIESRSTRA